MGNDASWVSVVDVCRGSLVRTQVGEREGSSKYCYIGAVTLDAVEKEEDKRL